MTTKPQHRRAVLSTWWRWNRLMDPEPAAPRRSERTQQGPSGSAVAWDAEAVPNV
jgi:hypothetical protein